MQLDFLLLSLWLLLGLVGGVWPEWNAAHFEVDGRILWNSGLEVVLCLGLVWIGTWIYLRKVRSI